MVIPAEPEGDTTDGNDDMKEPDKEDEKTIKETCNETLDGLENSLDSNNSDDATIKEANGETLDSPESVVDGIGADEATIKETNGEILDAQEEEDDSKLIEEIRKRKLIEEPSQEGPDTSNAVCVKFSPEPESLDLFIVYKRSVKWYVSEETELKFMNDLSLSKKAGYSTLTGGSWDAAGSRIYVLSGKYVIMWNLTTNETQLEELFDHKAVCIEAGDEFLAVGDVKGNLYVIDQDALNLNFYLKLGDDNQIDGLAIHNDTIYATVGNKIHTVDVVEKKSGKDEEHLYDMECCVVQNRSFVGGSSNGELVLFNLHNLAFQGLFKIGKKTGVTAMAPVKDTYVVVAFDNGYIKMYSLFPNKLIGIVGVLNAFATSMSVSNDDKWLIVNDSFHKCAMFGLSFENASTKKAKKARTEKHLPSSSTENKDSFFSLM